MYSLRIQDYFECFNCLPFSLRNQECDGFKMFAKQKISCTELNVTISIDGINCYLLRGPEPDCLFL